MFPNDSAHDLVTLFDAAVTVYPERVAVDDGAQTWTYGQLAARSRQLASTLAARAGRSLDGERVAFCVKQSFDQVALHLAILRLGAAYVPLDPHSPPSRLRLIVEEAAAAVLVTDTANRARLEDLGGPMLLEIHEGCYAEQPLPPREVRPQAPCYVIFTSGSTGRPKGVVISHEAVIGLVLGDPYLDTRPEDGFARMASVGFDAATLEIWAPLLVGARVVFVDMETALDAQRLKARIAQGRITMMFMTTALFNQHAGIDPGVFQGLRWLTFGGEAASSAAVQRVWDSGAGPTRLGNVYGPTENTVFSTVSWVTARPEDGAPIPIGHCICGTTAAVVDAAMRPLPPGEVGELLLGGPRLALEYLGQPERSAERFVRPEFGGGERFYRTGDLVVQNPDGQLVFMGRVDNQVKIRGFRVELEEIEQALDAHPAIAQAVVTAPQVEGGQRRLEAWLVLSAPIDAHSLQGFLKERLPHYMVPGVMRVVDQLPLSVNGKVDRRALESLPSSPLPRRAQQGPAVTPLEASLRLIWAQHLGLDAEEIGPEDGFYSLGGQSLGAVAVVADTAHQLQIALPIGSLLQAQTLRLFAAAVAQAPALELRAVAPTEATQLPLSAPQRAIYLHEQLLDGVPVYNEPLDIRFHEDLDVQALHQALSFLVARHEALRLRVFEEGGVPMQAFAEPRALPLPQVDLRAHPEPEAESRRLGLAHVQRPLDLNQEGPFRALLLRTGERAWRLFVVAHHIAIDGVSMFQIFLPELELAYAAFREGKTPSLPALPCRYRDLLAHLEQPLEPEALDYWRRALSGVKPTVIGEAPTLSGDPAGDIVPIHLPAALLARVQALARREGVSTFQALYAGFVALLARSTGEQDICVATVFAGRDVRATRPHIGNFLNTTLLRTRCEGSFLSLLAAARRTCDEARAQKVPFEDLARAMPGLTAHIAFVLEPDLPQSRWVLDQLDLHNGGAKFGLTVMLEQRGEEIFGYLEYRSAWLSRDTVNALGQRYVDTLDALTRAPEVSVLHGEGPARSAPVPATASASRWARTPLEQRLLRAFRHALQSEQFGVQDDFFEAGGDSLRGMEMVAALSASGLAVKIRDLLQHRSPAALAAFFDQGAPSGSGNLLPLSRGSMRPLFLVHPAGGSAVAYRTVAERLPGVPVYGLERVPGDGDHDLVSLAAHYVAQVQSVCPQGPYLLGGWSFGGIVAFEMARQLEAQGERVEQVVLIDSRPVSDEGQWRFLRHMLQDEAALLALIGRHLATLAKREPPVHYAGLRERPDEIRRAHFVRCMESAGLFSEALNHEFIDRFVQDFTRCNQMLGSYTPSGPCAAPLLLLRATEISQPYPGFPAMERPSAADRSYGWQALSQQPVLVEDVPGTHESLVFEPHAGALARVIQRAVGA